MGRVKRMLVKILRREQSAIEHVVTLALSGGNLVEEA